MYEQHGWNRWFPVRCCCTPRKVFGFIKLNTLIMANGRIVVKNKEGTLHELRVRSIRLNAMACTPEAKRDVAPEILDKYMQHDDIEYAVYSDDRPIEFWRNMPDFIEAK